MAVGKGSMARASKAAGKKAESTAVAKEQEIAVEVINKEDSKVMEKKTAPKKAGTKKTTTKKAAVKTEEIKEVSSAVLEVTSEQVMKQIVYQKSSQVLDREAKTNETFGVGEAMPIYFF